MALVLDQLQLAISEVGYSQAIEMGDNNALSVSVTLIVGSAVPAVTVEGSNDLSNWSVGSIGGSVTVTAAPSFVAGNFTAIACRYVRVKVAAGTAAILVSVNVNPQQL